jgi:hypothetical protein
VGAQRPDRPRSPRAPHLVDEHLDADPTTRGAQQDGENAALFRPTQLDRHAVDGHRERTEESGLDHGAHGRMVPTRAARTGGDGRGGSAGLLRLSVRSCQIQDVERLERSVG